MSIESEITRLVEAKQDLAAWLKARNVSVPNGALLGTLVKLLNNIPLPQGRANVDIDVRYLNGSGELLISDTVVDIRTVQDSFICCVAASTDNKQLLALTPTCGQYYSSSLAVNVAPMANITRVYHSNFFWMIDPDRVAPITNGSMLCISVWSR